MSAGFTENDARTTGHAWVDGNCARCGADAPRPWAEDCAPSPENDAATMPTSQWCPIGTLNAHTYNYERTECIWCGPNGLAHKPGRWISVGDGLSAWSVTSPAATDA